MSFFNKLTEAATQKELIKGLVGAVNKVTDRVLDTYRKEEVDTQIEVLATKEELQGAVEELQGQVGSIDLSHLATKEELTGAVDGLASEVYVDEKIDQRTTGMATEEFVLMEILKAETADKEYDLSVFYTKSEVDGKVNILASKEELAGAKDELNANIADAVLASESKAMDAETIELFNGILDKLA